MQITFGVLTNWWDYWKRQFLNGMDPTGISKAERVAEIVVGLLGIVGAVIFAVWSRSWLSIVLAVAVTVLCPISWLRSRKLGEKEMIRRSDRALKTKDDANEMARWVP